MRNLCLLQQQIEAEAVQANTRTLSILYRNRTAKHLGFSAVDMALITLIMSPSKHLVRDDHGRWNHPDAVTTTDHLPRKPGRRFQQGFSSATVNKLIDARRCEAIRWAGHGAAVEVRLLPH